MSQNRDAPAYQEYAATMLARRDFRTMTLQERGLLYTLKNECWVNKTMPNDHTALAKMLGLQVAEVVGALPAVMPFFKAVGTDITCPELDDYRAHLDARRDKQSAGGKRGSAATNDKRKKPEKAVDKGGSSTPPSTPPSHSRVSRQGQVESLVQSSAEQQSQNQSPVKGFGCSVDTEFVSQYESVEGCTGEDYAKASGGD